MIFWLIIIVRRCYIFIYNIYYLQYLMQIFTILLWSVCYELLMTYTALIHLELSKDYTGRF